MTDQSLPCPVCQTKIPFDPKQLLTGILYTCPNSDCGAQIGLDPKAGSIKDTMDKLEDLKKNV